MWYFWLFGMDYKEKVLYLEINVLHSYLFCLYWMNFMLSFQQICHP